MERIITQLAVIGESTYTAIVLAIIGLVGTLATVGYKYKKDKPKPEDQSKVIFDQVNQFIKDQKQDRDDLRKELQEVKDELEEVRVDSRRKDTLIHNLQRDNWTLKEELKQVREAAKMVEDARIEAALKITNEKKEK